jgi:hypothetical protein
MSTTTRLIPYPEDRALEDVAYGQQAVPTRIFAFLLPVWRVQIRATVTEGEPYELIDRYLERGIAEGRLSTPGQLAEFFALDPVLVDRALRFLRAIGHVTMSGEHLALTDLGYRSVRDQVRYVVTHQDRRTLYFDAFASRPLTGAYYDPRVVTMLDPGEADSVAAGRDWPRFIPLFSRYSFRAEALAELAHHPDRDRYNLPASIDDPECIGTPDCVFLPAYVVRSVQEGCRVRLFAYTQTGSAADLDITDLYERTPEIGSVVETEETSARPALRDKADNWLERRGIRGHELIELDGGAWRAVLPASGFGEDTGLLLSKVGSFVLLGNDILHIWCLDEQVRCQALLQRADAYLSVRGRPDHDGVQVRVAQMARQLELGPVGLPDLHHMAVNAGKTGLAAQLGDLI